MSGLSADKTKSVLSPSYPENRKQTRASSRYLFPEGSTEEDKRQLVCQWWNEARFHLAMAIKSPTELNRMLGNSLSEETLQLYHKARKKGMPVFITLTICLC